MGIPNRGNEPHIIAALYDARSGVGNVVEVRDIARTHVSPARPVESHVVGEGVGDDRFDVGLVAGDAIDRGGDVVPNADDVAHLVLERPGNGPTTSRLEVTDTTSRTSQ